MLQVLNSLYKEIELLKVDVEFLANFDKLMDAEENIKRMLEDHNSPQKNNPKKKSKYRNTVEGDKILSDLRVKLNIFKSERWLETRSRTEAKTRRNTK